MSNKRSWLIIGTHFGSLFFILFYFLAYLIFPFQFNMLENFFCDLFKQPELGSNNLSFTVAFFALIAIFITALSFLLWYLNNLNRKNNFLKTCSIISSSSLLFLATNLHDYFIYIITVFGLIPLMYIGVNVIQNRHHKFIWLGGAAILLLIFYNVIYYLNLFESTWAIIQKAAIILSLSWVNLMVWKNKKGFQN